MLAQTDPGNIADYFSVQICLWAVGQNVQVMFQRINDCVVWTNITPVIILYNFVSDVFGQHLVYIIHKHCPSMIDTTFLLLRKVVC